MSEQSETITTNSIDNKSLTLVATALVAASNLLPTDLWRKIGALSAPVVTIAIAYIFKKGRNIIYMWIEQTRAERVYNAVLSDLYKKLDGCTNSKEKGATKRIIDKHENNLRELKIQNIKTFI